MDEAQNTVTEEARRTVWRNLLLADLNSRYFGHLSSRYYDLDLYSKIFLALMASDAVAGWVIWKDEVAYPYGVMVESIFFDFCGCFGYHADCKRRQEIGGCFTPEG